MHQTNTSIIMTILLLSMIFHTLFFHFQPQNYYKAIPFNQITLCTIDEAWGTYTL